MKQRRLTALLFLSVGLIIYGQEADEERRIPTIEELYLENPSLMAVVEQANSPDRDSKLLALDDIETLIESGEIQDNSAEVLTVLEFLSSEGVNRVVREGARVVNNYPMVRRKSLELLGRMGQESTDPELIEQVQNIVLDALLEDREVMNKSEAAYALGLIGRDEDGLVVRILSDIILRQTAIWPDNNFAYAVALAIEKIAEQAEGVLDYHAYTSLVTIMQGSYTRKVKDKALEVMQKLKQRS